ncbi:Eukaryotic translation initiation factor 2D [Terramyces sp. JEL0728]|nr:Eukaryotic translation initiation factor 2D [Terramyces sp. JEL0728]
MVTWGSIKRTLTNEKDYETLIDKATSEKYPNLNIEKASRLVSISNPQNNNQIINGLMERLKKKNKTRREKVVQLFDFLVKNSQDFQESLVNYPQFPQYYYSLPLSASKVELLQMIQEWSLLYGEGPFGQQLKSLAIACSEGMEEHLQPIQPMNLPSDGVQVILPIENMTIEDEAARVIEHVEMVKVTCDLFVEALNFNTKYLGDNNLARDLHRQCTKLKGANDAWISDINPQSEFALDLLLQAGDQLSSAFSTLSVIKEQDELKKAEDELKRAQKKYQQTLERNGSSVQTTQAKDTRNKQKQKESEIAVGRDVVNTANENPFENSQIKKITREFNDHYKSQVQLKNLSYSVFTSYSIYSTENPVLIEPQFQDILIPTVYLCWQYPIVPLLFTPKQVVTNYLYNGADLMVPGIISITREFEEGDIVGISWPGNPYPLVVGRALKSSMALRNEKEGKAVQNLHYYGDCLWELGDKSEPPIAVPELDNLALADGDDSENNPKQDQSVADKLEINQNITTDGIQEEMTSDVMDLLFEKAFTSSIIKMADNILPLSSSIFYSNHMLPSKPTGTNLDIKKSSFKKLSKFLKIMDKKGLINTKEKSGDLFVMSINRNHPLIIGKEAPKEKVVIKQETKQTIKHQELYKLPSNGPLKRLVQELPKEYLLEYYDQDAIDKLLSAYYTRQNLVDPANGRNIKVDPYLCDALLAKQEYSQDYMQRDILKDRFIQKMQPFYQLHLPNEIVVKRGKLVPITIQIKRRQGNKMVTLISNLETFQINPEEFSEVLKIKCASSSAVNVVDKRTQVMVQGSNVKQVVACLKDAGLPITMQNDKLMPSKFVSNYINRRSEFKIVTYFAQPLAEIGKICVSFGLTLLPSLKFSDCHFQMEKPVLNPLNQIEIQAERMSKDLVELLHSIDSRLQEYAHYTSDSLEIQRDATLTLCDQINTAVQNGSKLIQSMDEIMLSIDSLYSLGNELRLVQAVLTQLEAAYEQKKKIVK